MANIHISDLNSVGFELFSDSESYMMELSEDELGIQGGFAQKATVFVSTKLCIGVAVVTFIGSYVYTRW